MWAGGPVSSEKDCLAALGAPPELLEDAKPHQAVIWPENLIAWQLFTTLSTCWRYHPVSGNPIGFCRQSMQAELDEHPDINKQNRHCQWQKLQIMEREAIQQFSD